MQSIFNVGAQCDLTTSIASIYPVVTKASLQNLFDVGEFSYSNQITGLFRYFPINYTKADRQPSENALWFYYCFGKAALFADAVSTRLRLNYRIHLDSEFSALVENDTKWTGVLGMLQDGQVNAVADTFIATPSRLQFFAFNQPLVIETQVIAISNSQLFSSRTYVDLFQILRPYHPTTWLIFLAAISLFTVLLFIALLVKETSDSSEEEPTGNRSRFVSVSISLETLARIIFNQDTPKWVVDGSKSKTAAVLLLFWGLFVVHFVNLYSSEVFSTMTLDRYYKKQSPPFDDFVSMERAGYKLATTTTAQQELINQLVEEMNGSANAIALQNVLIQNLVSESTTAFANNLRDKKIAVFESKESRSCDRLEVDMAPHAAMPAKYYSGFFFPRHDATPSVNNTLRKAMYSQDARLHEVGLWKHQLSRFEMLIDHNKILSKMNGCATLISNTNLRTKPRRTPKVLTTKHLASTFLLLAAGCAVSLGSLFLEALMKPLHHSAVRNVQKLMKRLTAEHRMTRPSLANLIQCEKATSVDAPRRRCSLCKEYCRSERPLTTEVWGKKASNSKTT